MEQFMSNGVLAGPISVDVNVRGLASGFLNDKTFPLMIHQRVGRVLSASNAVLAVRVELVDEFVLLKVSLKGSAIVHVQTSARSHSIKTYDNMVIRLDMDLTKLT